MERPIRRHAVPRSTGKLDRSADDRARRALLPQVSHEILRGVGRASRGLRAREPAVEPGLELSRRQLRVPPTQVQTLRLEARIEQVQGRTHPLGRRAGRRREGVERDDEAHQPMLPPRSPGDHLGCRRVPSPRADPVG